MNSQIIICTVVDLVMFQSWCFFIAKLGLEGEGGRRSIWYQHTVKAKPENYETKCDQGML